MSKKYKTGYKRPPKSGQFKKGQSGNPDGRPKKKKADHSLQAAVQAMLTGKVPVIMNGQKHQMEVAEALVHRLKGDMLNGTSAECARAVKLLKEICPGYNVPEEFADAPTEINVKLIESDGFGNEFNPNLEEKAFLKALWRQHRDGKVPLSRIVDAVERKLGQSIIDRAHIPAEANEIRT